MPFLESKPKLADAGRGGQHEACTIKTCARGAYPDTCVVTPTCKRELYVQGLLCFLLFHVSLLLFPDASCFFQLFGRPRKQEAPQGICWQKQTRAHSLTHLLSHSRMHARTQACTTHLNTHTHSHRKKHRTATYEAARPRQHRICVHGCERVAKLPGGAPIVNDSLVRVNDRRRGTVAKIKEPAPNRTKKRLGKGCSVSVRQHGRYIQICNGAHAYGACK